MRTAPRSILAAFTALAALAALSTAACRSDAPSGPTLGLPVAEASRSCGPTDGPAVQLRLSTVPGEMPAPPIAFITVYRPRTELAGRRFVLGGSEGGAALQRVAGGELVTAVVGLLTVKRVTASGTSEGQVSVRFTDGTRIAQRFSAPWRENAMMCG